MTEYLDDLASDFSVFHRIDDIKAMDAARFFKLAVRLPAYQGVLAARVAAQRQESGPDYVPRSSDPVRSGATIDPDHRAVDPTRQAIQADPVLSQVISFGSG